MKICSKAPKFANPRCTYLPEQNLSVPTPASTHIIERVIKSLKIRKIKTEFSDDFGLVNKAS